MMTGRGQRGESGDDVEEFLKSAGYGAIFVLSFISAMGLPVGAELALIGGGVLASGQVPGEGKPLNLALVILVALAAEVLGSLAGYGIGRYGGRPLVDKVGQVRPAHAQGPRPGRGLVRPPR